MAFPVLQLDARILTSHEGGLSILAGPKSNEPQHSSSSSTAILLSALRLLLSDEPRVVLFAHESLGHRVKGDSPHPHPHSASCTAPSSETSHPMDSSFFTSPGL